MSMLEARDLTVAYGELKAVRRVSFNIDAGEIVAFVGSNGAGKSSTLRSIIGLAPAVEGELRLDGHDIKDAQPASRVHLGVSLSPEGRRLFGRMSVEENLRVGAHGVRVRGTIKRHLDEIYTLFPRVFERRRQLAHTLSGGEQQMVAIGRALMANPRLLMLDEPSLGIAPKIVVEIADAIVRINQEHGMSIMLVEQNARLALRLSHRAYALEHGEIVRQGTGNDLLTDPFVQKAYLGV